jgi:murein L,D-transpeptidase YcbB/YkuD
LAQRAAPKLAAHIAQKKHDYDRKLLKGWQRAAGIEQDGIYGRGSAAAMRVFAKAAPRALYNTGTDVYPWA